jgi:O-antigen/teichoic acid export membrane protein
MSVYDGSQSDGDRYNLTFMQSLETRVQSGLRWAAMRQIVTGLVGTLGAVAYTHFIQPEDLGAYALAALVYSGLFLLVQAPFRDAVVYFQEQENTNNREHGSTHSRAAFWLLVGFSGIAVLMVLVFADHLGRLYNSSRSANLARGMAIVFLFQALAVVPAGLLLKGFRFALHEGLYTIVELVLLAGWVTLAALGFGPWSLVVPYLVSSIFWVASTWIATHFQPWPIPPVGIFRQVICYSRNLLGSKLLVYLSRNLDNAAVGTLGEKALGWYSFGENQAEYFGIVIGETVAQITLPAMAAVQSQIERLRSIYLDMLRLTAAASIPMQMGALVLADMGIRVFLGEKWLGAAPVFRAYLVLWLLRTLLGLGDALTSATGHPQVRLVFDLIQLPLFAAGTWLGLRVWGGIAGVAWALVIVRLAVGCFYFVAVLRLVQLKVRAVLRLLLPCSLAGAGMGLCVHFMRGILPCESEAVKLGFLVMIGVGVYAAIFYVLDSAGFRRVFRMVKDILVPAVYRNT